MSISNLDRYDCITFRHTLRSIGLIAGLLLLIPDILFGQVDSQESKNRDPNLKTISGSRTLNDIYRELALAIERETQELEKLKLVGRDWKRVSEARQNAALAEKIDLGLVQLEEIREEKTRLLKFLENLETTGNKSDADTAQGVGQPPETATDQARVSIAGIQARFRLPCGCVAEIHCYVDAAGSRYCLHHHHRTGKMSRQTLPEYTGAIPAGWVQVVALADEKTTLFRDSRTGQYLIHRK
jgi:hypothetical protein